METFLDFVVDIPEGKKPVILQLSDPQMSDIAQDKNGCECADTHYWGIKYQEERCFSFIRETVERVQPDLILIAGDLTYGIFDHNGKPFANFVEFMESFAIPWAPVLGNHETESDIGVDWQCALLEGVKHCLFKQRSLTGNGNYTVGIRQGGKLLRVFYMLDSNSGCPSERSLANGHSKHPAGFGEDQIEWYTEDIKKLKTISPFTKIAFMFHMPIYVFEKAFIKYGYEHGNEKKFPIDIDRLENREEGDCGYILLSFNTWDQDEKVWKGLKELGVDCICVGHVHEVYASVMYEDVRLQFGVKSSTYDSNIYETESGERVKSWLPAGKPIVGGTVMELGTDGKIQEVYHYLCKNAIFESDGE